MFSLIFTNHFKRDIRLLQRKGYDMILMKEAVKNLEENGRLPNEYRPHKLAGDYFGYWEAHLLADWLLIWRPFEEEREIWLTRTGTHSDLFK